MNKKTWITAYDTFSAKISVNAGVDALLVGDSLGMTVYGFDSTREVTKEIMRNHFCAVKKVVEKREDKKVPIVLDFPFECDKDILTAIETAEYFADKGANTFKIEGGQEMIPIFMELISRGYEIVGHLGLTPQKIENWELQGSSPEAANEIFNTAKKFAVLGIKTIVVECIPESLASCLQKEIPELDFIGIGAGRGVNGQVLVFDDVIGKTSSDFSPRFLKRFSDVYKVSESAVNQFVSEVKNKTFPAQENVY